MNITVFTSEAAARVTKSDLRSQRATVNKLTRQIEREKRKLDKLEERYAKQNPGAGAAPTAPKPSASAKPESDLTDISRRELVKMLVEMRKLDAASDAKGMPIADLRALFLRKRKPRSKPSPKPASRSVSGIDLEQQKAELKGKKYTPSMKGAKWQNKLNANASVAPRQEGFWRRSVEIEKDDHLPFPVKFSVPGYNKKEFLKHLEEAIASSRGGGRPERGHSPNRWTGKADNGSGAHKYKGWHFPQGYITYIKGGMPPTRAFYKVVMGKDLPGLPEYPDTHQRIR